MLQPLNLDWAFHAELPPSDFVLPGLSPGAVGLLVAPGGTGKSFFALEIAIALASGREIANGVFPAMPRGTVVYLAGEENNRIFAERLRACTSPLDRAALDSSLLKILPMSGESSLLLSSGAPTALLTELNDLARGARLIILDPIRRLHDGDENCSDTMTRVVVALERLAKNTGAAVLAVHHANRASSNDSGSQNASRGSSALVDAARWQANLSVMDEKTATHYGIADEHRRDWVALDIAKSNYLRPAPRRWLHRQPGGFLKLASLKPQFNNPRAQTAPRRL